MVVVTGVRLAERGSPLEQSDVERDGARGLRSSSENMSDPFTIARAMATPAPDHQTVFGKYRDDRQTNELEAVRVFATSREGRDVSFSGSSTFSSAVSTAPIVDETEAR